MSAACISTPVSWLRLETFALDARDAAIGEHVAACPACKHCLDEIRGDMVALPPLVAEPARQAAEGWVARQGERRARAEARRDDEVPERRARFRWWFAAGPLLAAAVLAIVLRPVKPAPDAPDQIGNVATVKGVGDVVLGVVRDRDGTIRDDVATFRTGDRWKVEITCATDHAVWIDVAVVEAGALAPDHPLAPAQLPCGNKVVVPGAFAITGGKANKICVRAAADLAPRRALPAAGEPDVACVTITPER